ncbi:MAG: triacylglycerol lipase [Clostridia bacterium]|nr:triacylglycerol lipase [Clostridia bacterium]
MVVSIALLYGVLCSLLANGYTLLEQYPLLWIGWGCLFLFCQFFAGTWILRGGSRRLRITCHGGVLLVAFLLSVCVSVIFHFILAFRTIPETPSLLLRSGLLCVATEFLLFWNGILCVYITSYQLGVKQRLVGILCGMIPIANLIALGGILRTVFREVLFESEKAAVNAARKTARVCDTKYPILLVHGVFFRDTKYFNYWGRIPAELERNGARVFYGNHPSAASVADCGAQLAARIKEIVAQEGCEKVHIIAHSKGGLDCRYALAHLGAAPYVASLTTINTPHRGCLFADYLLEKVPIDIKNKVADTYNKTLRKLGEQDADFLAAVGDLTAAVCIPFDLDTPCPEGVLCRSVGSILPKASGGQFPLNFSYHLVKYFDGANDGLVSEDAFAWGEQYTLLTPKGERGISHGDMIDLNRQNLPDFDVREFYVELVSDLKNRGL